MTIYFYSIKDKRVVFQQVRNIITQAIFETNRKKFIIIYRTILVANLSIYNDALEQKKKSNKGITADQMSLFEEGEIEGEQFSQKIPNIPEFKDAQKMKFEKEALGMYLTTHPMKEYEQYLKGRITDVLGNINPEVGTDDEEDVASKSSAYREGQRVKLAGLITTIKTIVTKKGEMMLLSDLPHRAGAHRLSRLHLPLGEGPVVVPGPVHQEHLEAAAALPPHERTRGTHHVLGTR